MAERKSVLLRLDPAVHDALARWAADELRSSNAQIEFLLRRALVEAGRLPEAAGAHVIESRLVRLSYAPEIAQTMLRRQQAEAVVAARQRIVEGAVGMVEQALARLEDQDLVVLDNERRAAMVSNLLVVLCSDHGMLPVVNVGTLYS